MILDKREQLSVSELSLPGTQFGLLSDINPKLEFKQSYEGGKTVHGQLALLLDLRPAYLIRADFSDDLVRNKILSFSPLFLPIPLH